MPMECRIPARIRMATTCLIPATVAGWMVLQARQVRQALRVKTEPMVRRARRDRQALRVKTELMVRRALLDR